MGEEAASPGGTSLSVELSSDPDARCAAGGQESAWLPDAMFVRRFAAAVLTVCPGDAQAPAHELSIRLVGEREGARLNQQYRGVDRATNVLSFPSGLPAFDGLRLLGDLLFCPAVIAREADGQGKRLADHWAHLIVHGTLHLLGHDHEQPQEAQAMESLEIQLLSAAGIADPYRGTADDPDE